jgi:protein SCO1/2
MMKIKLIVVLVLVMALLVQCKRTTVHYLPILGNSDTDSISKDTIYHTIADFKLMDQMGQMVTQDTFKHKVYVANFFFVTCPGICKKMNNELERVQKAFVGNTKVKFVSYTVNPEQDTIPALLEYAKLHDAVPYQWYFLRGDKSVVLDLAVHSYLAETDGYLVHSQNLTLVDMEGRIRGIYSGVVPADVDKLIADINLLLKEEKENEKS